MLCSGLWSGLLIIVIGCSYYIVLLYSIVMLLLLLDGCLGETRLCLHFLICNKTRNNNSPLSFSGWLTLAMFVELLGRFSIWILTRFSLNEINGFRADEIELDITASSSSLANYEVKRCSCLNCHDVVPEFNVKQRQFSVFLKAYCKCWIHRIAIFSLVNIDVFYLA